MKPIRIALLATAFTAGYCLAAETNRHAVDGKAYSIVVPKGWTIVHSEVGDLTVRQNQTTSTTPLTSIADRFTTREWKTLADLEASARREMEHPSQADKTRALSAKQLTHPSGYKGLRIEMAAEDEAATNSMVQFYIDTEDGGYVLLIVTAMRRINESDEAPISELVNSIKIEGSSNKGLEGTGDPRTARQSPQP